MTLDDLEMNPANILTADEMVGLREVIAESHGDPEIDVDSLVRDALTLSIEGDIHVITIDDDSITVAVSAEDADGCFEAACQNVLGRFFARNATLAEALGWVDNRKRDRVEVRLVWR